MAFGENQRRKLKERIQAAAATVLEPDEPVEASVYATRHVRIWPLVLVVVAVAVVLAINGRELRGWVIGAAIGAYVLATVRNYYVLLTDRRLVILRIPTLSPKRFELDRDIPLEDIESFGVRDGWLVDYVAMRSRSRGSLTLKVGRPWKPDVEAMQRRLTRAR